MFIMEAMNYWEGDGEWGGKWNINEIRWEYYKKLKSYFEHNGKWNFWNKVENETNFQISSNPPKNLNLTHFHSKSTHTQNFQFPVNES